MLSARKKTRFALILVIFLGFTAGTTAASITAQDNEVWLNPGQDQSELEYECSSKGEILVKNNPDQENSVEKFQIEGNGTLTTEDFRDSSELTTGSYNILLNCSGSNDSISFDVKELSVTTEGEGKSFFGQRMTFGEFTNPAEVGLDVNFGVENGEIDADKVSFSSLTSDVSNPDWDSDQETLEMDIASGFNPQKEQARFKLEYGSHVSTNLDVPVSVYPWKPSFVGENNPGRKVQYENLGDFSYKMNINSGQGFSDTLYQENFVVTVTDLKSGEVLYEEKEWVETSEPEDAQYKLVLSNIPDLDTGRYKFKFEILGENDRKAPVDSFRVVNSLKFEGQVRDSTGRGVKSEMVMVNEERSVPVNTGSDGRYSVDIGDDRFQTVNLDFFDREKSSSDTGFVFDQVDLGIKASTGGSEAIKYQFWDNSPVSVPGLDPVNMMAVKFGHHIGGGAQASMAFNPSNINPEKLKVFECTSWNFLGKSCMGTWEQVPENDVSVNYANWRVKINNLNLHHISEDTGGTEKEILMNAYLVGTNSKLGLKGEDRPLSVNSARISAGDKLEVSGVVLSSEGNEVDDANVTVKLMNGSEAVESYSTLSDSGGSFTAEGDAPQNAGDYRMEINIQKDPYQSFTKLSDSSIEVFYSKGLEISNPGDLNIELGEQEELEFELENTGQTTVKDIEVTLDGLESDLYEKVSTPETIESGEKANVVYRLDIPEAYCPYPCGQPPRFNLQVEGTSIGEEITTMTTVFTEVNRRPPNQEDSENQTPENNSENNTDESSQTSFIYNAASTVTGPTGAFLQRQSSLNIALGLIMLFTMVLAAAVKKKKDSGQQGRGRFGNSRGSGFQSYSGGSGGNSNFGSREPETGDFGNNITEKTPDSGKKFGTDNSSTQEHSNQDWRKSTGEETETDESGNEDVETNSSSDEDSKEFEQAKENPDKYVCEETGEVFDTEAALRMHRKINGID